MSDTDRLNRSVGLPPAKFTRDIGPSGGVETTAENRVAGLNLRWREHPFEWVEGRRWSVLRLFAAGALRWYTVELSLQAKIDGGTLLRYVMTVEPRHWLGRLIVALELRWKQRPRLARAFSRIDAFAQLSSPRPPVPVHSRRHSRSRSRRTPRSTARCSS